MERNTQFSKFADGVVNEITSVHDGAFQASDWWQEQASKIIAQRAYDLAKHALDYAFTHTTEDAISAIPDLTELPDTIPIKVDPSLPANTIRFEIGGKIYEERL